MEEIWKDITGYENLYMVSNYGNIKRVKSNRILKPALQKITGYLRLSLCKNNIKKNASLHRIVAQEFIENFKNEDHINHKDYDKTNNYLDNLEIVSRIENQCHRRKNENNSSKYMGVHYHKSSKKYRANISINGERIYIGIFDDEEDAYNARVQYEKDNNIINKYI